MNRSRDATGVNSPRRSEASSNSPPATVVGHQNIVGNQLSGIKPLVVLAAAVSALGGLIFGFDIGGSGGTFTMTGFRKQFDWPILEEGEEEPQFVTDEQGWITSVFALGAVAGSLVSGYATDKFGRKTTIIGYSIIFTIGAIIMGACNEIIGLYIGRFIGGIAVGGLSMSATMYQSEIAPERIRGMLVSLQQLSITFGIFLAAVCNVGLQHWNEGWRFSYCGNGFFSVALMFLMFFMPESPRWLYKVGQVDKARATLHKVMQADEVDYEFEKIKEDERLSTLAAQSRWTDLFKKANNMRYRTGIAVAVLFLQQCTGINAVFYFAPVIFADFLSTNIALLCNLLLTAINFLSTFICIKMVDKHGRRTLLVWSSFLMAAFCVAITLLSSSLADYENNSGIAYTIVAFCALYVVAFAFGWGPVGWIVPAEIFPQDLRGKGMTMSTTANWLCNFAIGRLTPEILRPNVFNLWGTFLFFGAWCLGMGFFTLLCVPETAQIPLEDMDGTVVTFRKLSLIKRLTKINLTVDKEVAAAVTRALHSGKDIELTSDGQIKGGVKPSTVHEAPRV